jgi:Domain of unknown function (DU1801)
VSLARRQCVTLSTMTSENKTKPTKISVAAFVAAVADQSRRADAKVLLNLMQTASGEKPKMWGPSIIGFGSYHYKYETGREGDMPLVGFSPRKAATVLYVTKDFKDAEPLLAKLGKCGTSKGCMYVKRLEDVDLKVLQALIVKSITVLKGRYPV